MKAYSLHGGTGTRLYRIYHAMKQRCYYAKGINYAEYGGRGISICAEWKEDFTIFRTWALANGYEDSLSIDRKSSKLNYTPDNCRWVTKLVQSANRSKQSNNTSGYKGVRKRGQRYNARIHIDSVGISIGNYDTIDEAAAAYDRYVIDNGLEHTLNKERNNERCTRI